MAFRKISKCVFFIAYWIQQAIALNTSQYYSFHSLNLILCFMCKLFGDVVFFRICLHFTFVFIAFIIFSVGFSIFDIHIHSWFFRFLLPSNVYSWGFKFDRQTVYFTLLFIPLFRSIGVCVRKMWKHIQHFI